LKVYHSPSPPSSFSTGSPCSSIHADEEDDGGEENDDDEDMFFTLQLQFVNTKKEGSRRSDGVRTLTSYNIHTVTLSKKKHTTHKHKEHNKIKEHKQKATNIPCYVMPTIHCSHMMNNCV